MEKLINPIIKNSDKGNTSDPYVIRDGDFYYHCYANDQGVFVAKSDTLKDIGSGECIRVYDSETGLKAWYAPELHKNGGKWYIYAAPDYGDGLHIMTVLVSDAPMGKYENLGIIKGLENKWSIDGTVLKYNNELYFVWTCCIEMYIQKMESPCALSGEPMLLSKAEYPFELRQHTINEGPAVLYRNGKILVVYSANDSICDEYCLGLLIFSGEGDILDKSNWTKHPEAIFEKTDKIFGPGHCSFTTVTENGNETDYIVYHANTESGTGWNGRHVFIKPFSWDEKGMPVLGKPEF